MTTARAVVGGLMVLAATTSAIAQWDPEDSGTKSNLRGVHRVGHFVWASGTSGVVLRSEDNGYLWQQCAIPPDAGNLDFRGVWGWDENHAVVMSSGVGSASRLYETTDGCSHWRLVFTNQEPEGFWDAIAFWNQQQGILLGDPLNGRFVILRTNDGGRHWVRDNSSGLDADPRGESAFAASNSALALSPDEMNVYFGTGGMGGPRLFRFDARVNGKSDAWNSVKLPVANNSKTAGIFSIGFRDSAHGVAVGGDYEQPNQREKTAVWTPDGGLTWSAASDPPTGYRSAVAWDQDVRAWIAVGPNGSDVSYDDGKTWKRFDGVGWSALSLPWAVGLEGKIAMLNEAAVKRVVDRLRK